MEVTVMAVSLLISLLCLEFSKAASIPKRKKITSHTSRPKTSTSEEHLLGFTTPATESTDSDTLSREGCIPPEVVVNGSSVDGGGGGTDFASVQEVQFLGVIGPLEQKRVCKIKCLNGVWVGPLCTIDQESRKFQPMLRQCLLRPPPKEVAMSLDGKLLHLKSDVTLPHGSVLDMRCSEVGTYKFSGHSVIRCGNGQWSSPMPRCMPTSLQRNFSIDVAPTIVFNVVSGKAGVSIEGEVIIIPGSIVHFDCLYKRKDGNPEWSWTASHRQYPSAWAIAVDERSWKYRLSIYYAKSHDNGTFICTTPKGFSNEIKVRVKDVQCPPIDSVDRNRVMAVEGTTMHSQARFACMEGFNLIGPEEITCTASGVWSHASPFCEVIQCPPLTPDDPHLRFETHNRTYGSRVMFFCPSGYRLVGNPFIICLKNQTWSDSPPSCQAIECQPPLAPINGRVLNMGRYLTGDFLQYTCNAGFIIVGESMVICNEHGEWTHPPPACKPACEFPGVPANGQVIPTKFHYDIGELINVECASGYRLLGAKRLRCTASGHWSSPLAHCRPYIHHS